MKSALCATSFLFLVAWCQGLTPQPCCNGTLVERHKCADGTKLQIRCEHVLLLQEYNITKDGLTTLDTPDYIWAANESDFCVGRWNTKSSSSRLPKEVDIALVCFEALVDVVPDDKLTIYGILVLISSVFLILTVSVYFLLPQLRDLQGKCIMCQCGSLAIAYLNLGTMQLASGTDYSDIILSDCSVNSFMMYFWLMATFFWLNVVSINIYRSVINSSHLKKTETRQFFYYNVYAWGGAGAFLVWALITNYVEGEHLKPGFGGKQCWFAGNAETWLFFYGPMAIILVTNIVLFVMASIALWKTATNYEARTLDTLKYKFFLYLKLFLVTGTTWIFEVASFVHGSAHVLWSIMDVVNCLQGLIFFLVLILFRKRALVGLKDRGIGGVVVRWLLSRFQNDRETENIIEEDHEDENTEAPFNVNLN